MGIITTLSGQDLNQLIQNAVPVDTIRERLLSIGLATIDQNGQLLWDGPLWDTFLTRIANALAANDAVLKNANFDIKAATSAGYEIVQSPRDVKMVIYHRASAQQALLALEIPLVAYREALQQLTAANQIREVR